jgi:Fe-S oxidoreductase
LTVNGCEWIMPDQQRCCGALLSRTGLRESFRELARQKIAAFVGGEFHVILANAAGCGGKLKGLRLPVFETRALFWVRIRDGGTPSGFVASWRRSELHTSGRRNEE